MLLYVYAAYIIGALCAPGRMYKKDNKPNGGGRTESREEQNRRWWPSRCTHSECYIQVVMYNVRTCRYWQGLRTAASSKKSYCSDTCTKHQPLYTHEHKTRIMDEEANEMRNFYLSIVVVVVVCTCY